MLMMMSMHHTAAVVLSQSKYRYVDDDVDAPHCCCRFVSEQVPIKLLSRWCVGWWLCPQRSGATPHLQCSEWAVFVTAQRPCRPRTTHGTTRLSLLEPKKRTKTFGCELDGNTRRNKCSEPLGNGWPLGCARTCHWPHVNPYVHTSP